MQQLHDYLENPLGYYGAIVIIYSDCLCSFLQLLTRNSYGLDS